MTVRPARIGERPTARQPALQAYSFPAPSRGWVTVDNQMDAAPLGAYVLENAYPRTNGLYLRGGSERFATVGTLPVQHLFAYNAAQSNRKMFAACNGSVYDITNPASATAIPTPVITGLTGGKLIIAQMANAGGDFLLLFNGSDVHRVFNGTIWATNAPAITFPVAPGNPTDTSGISGAFVFKNRLFMVQKDARRAWFLPVANIGGAAQLINLDGVFKRGGLVAFGATWSSDSGDGPDDRCVFVSTEGEVLIFEGSDPSSASSWGLVGRYDASPPMGRNAFETIGGDLLIATKQGLIPLSQISAKDPSMVNIAALSRNIEPDWLQYSALRTQTDWDLVKWTENSALVVCCPPYITQETPGNFVPANPSCLVLSLDGGGWAKFVPWDCQTVVVFGGRFFFGDSAGRVFEGDVTGADDGDPYYFRFATAFSGMGAPALAKTATQARASWLSSIPLKYRSSMSADFSLEWPAVSPIAPAFTIGEEWDVATWDVSDWNTTPQRKPETSSQIVSKTGFFLSYQVVMGVSQAEKIDIAFLGANVAFMAGSAVA
ncbi:MAG: hypothetical protein ACRCU5_00225 [Rhizobiaceae bacterium]